MGKTNLYLIIIEGVDWDIGVSDRFDSWRGVRGSDRVEAWKEGGGQGGEGVGI